MAEPRLRKENIYSGERADEVGVEMISVVISTRNRGYAIVSAIKSILRNDFPRFEIVVVDQSEGEGTAVAMRQFLQDPRISYVRSPGVGLSNGRNLGVHNSKGVVIAVTDDDCEVGQDWLQQLNAAFATDVGVGVVFGTTSAGPYDPVCGMIPACRIERPFLARKFRERSGGMGACMAFRRDVWERLHGFDELLGVGALFRAGEETDFATRALFNGYFVYETPGATVIHNGFRPLEDVRELIFSYWFGAGAALVKLIKCGHVAVFGHLFLLGWRWFFHASPVAASFGAHASRRLRLGAFTQGMAKAAIIPVDRSRGHFSIPDSGVNAIRAVPYNCKEPL